MFSLNYLYLALIIFNLNLNECVTQWKLNKDTNKIEAIENSLYTLQRPYDLVAFIRQDERIQRLAYLRQLLSAKELSSNNKQQQDLSVSAYQETFYATDTDCLKAGQPLVKFSFYESNYNSFKDELIRHLRGSSEAYRNTHKIHQHKQNSKDTDLLRVPYCVSKLPFSLLTFDHLESIQQKVNISLAPEHDLKSKLKIEHDATYGNNVAKLLDKNQTSWIYMSMASHYFRIKGDYVNSVSCLQRAIYYADIHFKGFPMLDLAHLLHKSGFLNDSLSIALSSLTYDPEHSLLHYFIGNIYATLGDLNSSFIWFDKAYKLDSTLITAFQKKHAILCHLKLEKYLEDQQEHLKKKLDELKDYQSLSDEWIYLNSKLNAETSSPQRKEYANNLFNEMIKNSKCEICDWNLKCKNVSMHCSIYLSESERYFHENKIEARDLNEFSVKMKAFEYNSNEDIYEFGDDLKGYKDLAREESSRHTYKAPTKRELDKLHSEFIKL